MGQDSSIGWTHHTFNPWMGCAKAHAGCTHCYAENSLPVAMRPGGKLQWGEVWQGGERVVKADSGWREPTTWARAAARAGERRRVFCASLADVLEVPADPPANLIPEAYAKAHDRVQAARPMLDAARARLWDVIRESANICGSCYRRQGHPRPVHHLDCQRPGTVGGLDWLLLTKRPEHWGLVPEHVRPLVWLGTSISDQQTANEWVPRLLDAEGFRVRFLSVEPLLGPVDLSQWLPGERWYMARCRGCGYAASSQAFHELRSVDGDADVACPKCGSLKNDADVPGIDWVIIGGESGHRARPFYLDWARDLVRQCHAAGVRVFVKQMGEVPVMNEDEWRGMATFPLLSAKNDRRATAGTVPLAFTGKGEDPAEWARFFGADAEQLQQMPAVCDGVGAR